MKRISDVEYEEALNNPKYIYIIDCASYPFVHLLSPDVLSRCKLLGLFEFLRKYDDAMSQPSTYLSKCVKWECIRVLNAGCVRGHTQPLSENIPENEDKLRVQECLSCLNDDEKQLVIDYYFGGYTYRELARQHGCSYEYIRRKIQCSLDEMRKMVYN